MVRLSDAMRPESVGHFVKIGVGVLRKDEPNYDFVKQYEMVDPESGRWSVITTPSNAN
jgi:hypothetical protein